MTHDIQLPWVGYKKFGLQLYDQREAVSVRNHERSKVQMLEVLLLLYGCMTRILRDDQFALLRTVHCQLPTRIIGFRRKDRIDLPRGPTERTESKSIETKVRKRRLIYAGRIVRMDNRRLHKAVLLCKILNGITEKRPAKNQMETNWRWCTQYDTQNFGTSQKLASDKPRSPPIDWMTAATDEGKRRALVDEGAEVYMREWTRDKETQEGISTCKGGRAKWASGGEMN